MLTKVAIDNRQDLVGLTCPVGLDQSEQDEFWMQKALALADYAQQQGEVPVGALVVLKQQCISVGYNQSIALHDPTAHAEMMALRQAGQVMQNYRLPAAELYVTLEPCAMCATALVHARIARLIYGASDPKSGAVGSQINLAQCAFLNHQFEVVQGVLGEQASLQLSAFFKQRRLVKKQQA
jgi:tRNA(adenine34) deaminase